ncbi:hypothetical protein KKI24_05565 [bacterium]|nr:hypothetical protein [bacterium]
MGFFKDSFGKKRDSIPGRNRFRRIVAISCGRESFRKDPIFRGFPELMITAEPLAMAAGGELNG